MASKLTMSGKQLAKRIATVLLMTVGILLVLAIMRAEATPIRPDIKKVLSQPDQPKTAFAPARAGWNGPDPQVRAANATYDRLGPQSTARNVRSSLLAAALPDYRILAGLALVILLLRRIRTTRRKALAAATAHGEVPDASAPTHAHSNKAA